MSTDRGGGIIGVLLQSGRVLVSGSSSDDYSGLGNVDLYDPVKGWLAGPKLQGDPAGSAAAPLPDGGALLAGGVPFFGGTDGPGPGPEATAKVYDPAAGSWKNVPAMSVARSGASATALQDGRVLVAGGYDRRIIDLPNPTGQPFCCRDVQILPQATTELFNPTSATWTPGPSLAHGRFGHLAVTLKGGRILVAGGATGFTGTPLDTAELFDPGTGRWQSAGSIGAPRSQFTLTALSDGRALLAGGTTADGSAALRSTLLYDSVSNQWSPGPDLANARAGHAAALLPDGTVLVSGGADQVGHLASSELLNSTGTAWSQAGALPGPRSDHFAVTLPSGRVLVVGGRGPIGALKTAALFDLSAFGALAPDRAPQGPGHWQSAAAAPIQTYAQSANLLTDGRVLVLPESTYESFTAELYDPASDTWTEPVSRKSTQSMFVASVLTNDRMLLLTLDQQGASPGHAEVIDLKTGTVKPASSPGTISGGRLNLLPDGRVWLTGGPSGSNNTQLYDPAADRWSPGAVVPPDMQVQTVTPVSGGRVLVGGVNRALVVDLASSQWSDAGAYPSYWSAYSATRLPIGDVLLMAGYTQVTTSDQRLVQVIAGRIVRWDHKTGMLGPAQRMPVLTGSGSAAVLADGSVLMAGGVGAISGDPVPGAEIYNPTTESWSAAASLPMARSQAAAVTLADGRVLLVGGFGMFAGSPPSLIYVPQLKTANVAANSPLSSALFATVGSVLIAIAFLLVAWQLVVRARRRNRTR